MKNSRMTWQDMYYDGRIDPRYECFDEEFQEIITLHNDYNWDNSSELEDAESYDDYHINLKNGKINRIG